MADQPLNILCFGDSLTEGYSLFGSKMTPYSKWMRDALAEKLHGEYEVNVETRGVSGECVVEGFRDRMRNEYSIYNQDLDPYDWVVFLGGTNDLGWGKEVDLVWRTILNVTDIPLQEGARVLLMTVPECKVKHKSLDERREELNSRIRGDDREGVFIFDLHKKMPYHTLDETQKNELWDDGLHFTEEGYEKIGKLVAERLLGILEGKEGRTESGFEVIVQSRFVEVEDEEKEDETLNVVKEPGSSAKRKLEVYVNDTKC